MNVATFDLPFIDFQPATVPVGQRLRSALTTLLVMGSFTSALFLGWGWGDLLQLFSHPARAVLLVALMLQLAFSVARARPQMSSSERAEGHFAKVVFWLFAAAGLVIVASSAFWDRRILLVLPGEDLTRYVGLGLFLIGVTINACERRAVEAWQSEGALVRPSRKPKGLLRLFGGAFRPGLTLAVVGLPMVFLSKLGLAGGACFAACSVVRAIWNIRAARAGELTSEYQLKAA